MKTKLLLIFLVFVCLAQSTNKKIMNWKGWGDTVSIRQIQDTGVFYYSRALSITDGEDFTLMCKCNDTTSAGFASDSLNFMWGYQLGNPSLTSTGVVDTVWSKSDCFIVDTITTDSLGTGRIGYTSPGGAINRYYRGIDTSSISGYAIQDRWVVSEWKPLIRFWMSPISVKHKKGSYVKTIFQLTQRNNTIVGNR
ncbi:MAG: hypothetical protein EHM12_11320 [Dehalococcoidia bacterium]|nr:MAG: hypothetical protein EHM12_11320 [Dehalococcoidia bacterium]